MGSLRFEWRTRAHFRELFLHVTIFICLTKCPSDSNFTCLLHLWSKPHLLLHPHFPFFLPILASCAVALHLTPSCESSVLGAGSSALRNGPFATSVNWSHLPSSKFYTCLDFPFGVPALTDHMGLWRMMRTQSSTNTCQKLQYLYFPTKSGTSLMT